MAREDQEAQGLKGQAEQYEATVLEFLDGEIASASSKVPHSGDQRGDVDTLVNSLLTESISATDGMESPKDPETEDIDKLFSDIFSSLNEAPAPLPASTPTRADTAVLQTLKEAAKPERETPMLRLVSRDRKQDATNVADAGECVRSPIHPLPFEPPETGGIHPAIEKETATLKTGTYGDVPSFAGTASKSTGHWRTLILISAFICLLASTGIAYLVGVKKPAPVQPAPRQTALPSAEIRQPATASRNLPEPEPKNNDSSVKAANLIPAAKNPARAPDPAPAKEIKSAAKSATPEPAAGLAANAESRASAALPEKNAPSPVQNTDASAPLTTPRLPENTFPLTTSTIASTPAATWNPPAAPASRNLPKPDLSSPLGTPPIRSVATPPVAISKVLPRYPAAARNTNARGTVVVDVQVDAQGKVLKVTPISGPSVFYQEAINAVMGWRFKPATLGGINTASSPQISLVFKAPN